MISTEFQISNLESGDCASSWRCSSDNRASSECQTDAIEQNDVKIQITKRVHAEIQTDQRDAFEQSSPKHYDKPSLYAFLKRATPIMIKELERNSQSTAFRHLQQQMRHQYLEQLTVLSSHREVNENYAALCISVNSLDQNEVAVGYGSLQHTDWCDHQAMLAVFRRREPSAKAQIFEMDSCVSCVVHNDRKSILTCGMYSGEILCWDGEEQIQVGGRHSSRVSSLQWRPIYERKRLMSAAVDGGIKLWKIREKGLVISEEFIVTSWDADVKLSSRPETPIGITSTGFSLFDDSQFIIGTEGGYVMLASLSSGHALFENGAKKCVTMTFKRHQGHVTSTSFSPYSRNVFLTSSVDKRARLYSQLQTTPLISLVSSEQLVKASWSPSRQMHIATATSSGRITFYDIRKPFISLAEIHLHRRITDFEFIGADKLVVSTNNGDLHLLQMSEGLLADVDSTSLDVVVNSLQDGIGFE